MRRESEPGKLVWLWMSWCVLVGEYDGAGVKMVREEDSTERRRRVGRRLVRVLRDYGQGRCRVRGHTSPRLVQECQRAVTVTVLQAPDVQHDQPSR